MVSIPVGLFTVIEDHMVHFHQLQRDTADRIRNRRVHERTGKEAASEDIVVEPDEAGRDRAGPLQDHRHRRLRPVLHGFESRNAGSVSTADWMMLKSKPCRWAIVFGAYDRRTVPGGRRGPGRPVLKTARGPIGYRRPATPPCKRGPRTARVDLDLSHERKRTEPRCGARVANGATACAAH